MPAPVGLMERIPLNLSLRQKSVLRLLPYHKPFYLSTFTATKTQIQPEIQLDKGKVEKSRHKPRKSHQNGVIWILLPCCLTVSH